MSIRSVDSLKEYLHTAMRLEHATIPPYLTALYSIRQGTNSDALHILRVVAVEEMLHLTTVANLLNAIGGTPNLLAPDFVPSYPTPMPDGLDDFHIHLEKFSKNSIETFRKIERPSKAPTEEDRRQKHNIVDSTYLMGLPGSDDQRFYSIGEFYEEISRGVYLPT